MPGFDSFGLLPSILTAVREEGYTKPTPVQNQTIKLVMEGNDVLAGAQTGTGKTAAFSLPMIHRLMQSSQQRQARRPIRALVMAPTRELAAQVEECITSFGKHTPIRSTCIFGGVNQNPQIRAIQAGVDILVATPGRLLDLNQQGHIDLSAVQIFVLDEADRMLDMGFIHDVRKVLALLPKQKQSLLFSATFSDEITALASSLLRNPKQVQVTPKNTTVERITQLVYPVGRDSKKPLLLHLLRESGWTQVLVFTRTKHGANDVANFLNKNGVTAMAIHGNKSQKARTEALSGFKTGNLRAMVATDIAARGLDIVDLPHVVNYDIPNISEDYVHRIGRTGRAGNEGHALSFVSVDEEGFFESIERFIKQKIPVRVVDAHAPHGEVAQPIAMGRQVLWGGKGPMPSRQAMDAAGKAARREMHQRIQERKANERDARAAKEMKQQQRQQQQQPPAQQQRQQQRPQQQYRQPQQSAPQQTKQEPNQLPTGSNKGPGQQVMANYMFQAVQASQVQSAKHQSSLSAPRPRPLPGAGGAQMQAGDAAAEGSSNKRRRNKHKKKPVQDGVEGGAETAPQPRLVQRMEVSVNADDSQQQRQGPKRRRGRGGSSTGGHARGFN